MEKKIYIPIPEVASTHANDDTNTNVYNNEDSTMIRDDVNDFAYPGDEPAVPAVSRKVSLNV